MDAVIHALRPLSSEQTGLFAALKLLALISLIDAILEISIIENVKNASFFFSPASKPCASVLFHHRENHIFCDFFFFVFLTLIEHFQSIFSPKWDSKASLISIFKSADGSWEQPLKLVVII